MDVQFVSTFIKPELFIIIVFLWCIGLYLKNAKVFETRYIPLIILGISVVFTTLYMLFVLNEPVAMSSVINGVIQGVIIASLTVFGNELIKHLISKK